MNPVFQREMRAQARGPKPWRLRLFIGGTAILGLALLLLADPAVFVGSGQQAFHIMNSGAVLLLAIVAPMLTHDLLSRERRDGTLGLLCSTPLTSREMIVGKVTAACSQALGAWLAMGPLLMLPMLQGGVGHAEILVTFVVEGSVTVCGLGAGLAASAWNRHAGWALVSAYAMLAMVLAMLMVPVGVVIAASSNPGSDSSLYVLTGVVLFCTALVAGGFFYLAAQEAEHAWTRIQFLGEAGDESLVELGVAASPARSAGAADPGARASGAGILPADGAVASRPGTALAKTGAGHAQEGGWLARWSRRRSITRRQHDPWLWLVSRRTDPMWQVGWFILGGYIWWLGTVMGQRTPVWPLWLIIGLIAFRIPGILREERRTGLLEVLATTPALGELPGAVCRRIWWDFGTFLAAHLLLVLILRSFDPGTGPVLTSLAVVLSVWSAPWIGLWIVRQADNYFVTVLGALIGIHGLSWLFGLVVTLCLGRWVNNSWFRPGSFAEAVGWCVQILAQLGLGLLARHEVLARFGGGRTRGRGLAP